MNYVNKAKENLGLPSVSKWKKIQVPILTRWGTAGKAAKVVCDDETMSIYKKIAQWTVNRFSSSNAGNKIASSILSLMEEPLILSDAKLSNAFMSYYFNEHYCWMERGDPALGGTLGFLSRHMLVRFYIMSRQLKAAMNGGWKAIDAFKEFKEFKHISKSQQAKECEKADKFMKIAFHAINKHFSIWTNALLFFGLFGEFETARCLSNILNGNDNTGITTGVIYSEFHQASIDLTDLRSFIESKCINMNLTRETFHMKKLSGMINELHSGKDIWGASYKGTWRELFLKHYAAHATHTQFVESAVKDSNFCSKKGRPEEMQSQVGQIRASVVRDLNRDARDAQVRQKLLKDGKIYKEDNYPTKIRGYHKVSTAISSSRSHANDISEDYKSNERDWKEMRSLVTKKYSDERKERKTAALFETMEKPREPNAVQRAKGYDETPQIRGEVQFGKLNANSHLHLFKKECIERGMTIEEANIIKITKAKDFIKETEKVRNPSGDPKFFKPLSDVIFDEWSSCPR